MVKFLINNEDLQVRKLVESDKILLAKWLSNPDVLQYYEGRDNPFDVRKVEQEFYTGEEGTTRCLIEFEGTSIGYVQFYEIDEEERKLYDYADLKEVIYGMDQFIGEVSYWNKGIGTKLVSSVVEYLIPERKADRIVMDPRTQNKRAIFCYEKCGFTKLKLLPKRELREGAYHDCWLMEYRKTGEDL